MLVRVKGYKVQSYKLSKPHQRTTPLAHIIALYTQHLLRAELVLGVLTPCSHTDDNNVNNISGGRKPPKDVEYLSP